VAGRQAPLEVRFWEKVYKTSSCWLWTASLDSRGYGQIGKGGRGTGIIRAHRLSWEIHFGPIENGLFVCHKCDVPSCVNPHHLFLGTPKENTVDMFQKRRARFDVYPDSKPKGEKNPRAVVTNDIVKSIRELYQAGTSVAELSRKYGLAYSTTYHICTGYTWVHVV